MSRMNKKEVESLRNGLELSYWCGEDDEKVFETLVAKAEAFDAIMEHLEKEYDYDTPATGDMYEDGEKQQLIIELWEISESGDSHA